MAIGFLRSPKDRFRDLPDSPYAPRSSGRCTRTRIA